MILDDNTGCDVGYYYIMWQVECNDIIKKYVITVLYCPPHMSSGRPPDMVDMWWTSGGHVVDMWWIVVDMWWTSTRHGGHLVDKWWMSTTLVDIWWTSTTLVDIWWTSIRPYEYVIDRLCKNHIISWHNQDVDHMTVWYITWLGHYHLNNVNYIVLMMWPWFFMFTWSCDCYSLYLLVQKLLDQKLLHNLLRLCLF